MLQRNAFNYKIYKHVSGTYNFVAFAVETLGPWSPDALSFFRDLAKRLVEVTRHPKAGSYFTNFLRKPAGTCCQHFVDTATGTYFIYYFFSSSLVLSFFYCFYLLKFLAI